MTSLNLLLGLAGQASFAQTTFMAVGGYGLAIMTTRFGINPWLAMLISLALSIALALIIGKPLLRLRGHYLSMGTIALALGVASFANASSFTNGGWGIGGVPPLKIGEFSFRNPVAFMWLAWSLCALSLCVYQLLGNSHIGRAWRALSTRQDISATLGIDVPRYKLLALVIAATMASLAGSFYVAFTRFVGPDLYDISVVINLMFMLFVGGLRSTVGPILGATFVILAPQAVAGFEAYQNLVFLLSSSSSSSYVRRGILGRFRGAQNLEAVLPQWLTRRSGPASIGRPNDEPLASAGRSTLRRGSAASPRSRKPRFRSVQVASTASSGPNGAGKSTMIGVITGFIKDFSGQLIFDGHDISHLDPTGIARLGVSRTFQQATPIAGLTALENVIVGMHRHYRSGIGSVLLRVPNMRREARELAAAASAVLDEFGLCWRCRERRGRFALRQVALPRDRPGRGDAPAHPAPR